MTENFFKFAWTFSFSRRDQLVTYLVSIKVRASVYVWNVTIFWSLKKFHILVKLDQKGLAFSHFTHTIMGLMRQETSTLGATSTPFQKVFTFPKISYNIVTQELFKKIKARPGLKIIILYEFKLFSCKPIT